MNIADSQAMTQTAAQAAPQPLQPRRERTRQKICEGAQQVFFEKGYAEATIGEIATAAKVRRSTLYTHFNDKNDILKQIADNYLQGVTDIVQQLPTPKPNRQDIDEWIKAFANFSAENPAPTLLLIHFSLAAHPPPAVRAFGKKLMQAYADHLPVFAEALDANNNGRAWARATTVLREIGCALCHHVSENGGGKAPYMLEVGADLLEQLVNDWNQN